MIRCLFSVLAQKGYRTRRERIDKENKERRRRLFLGMDNTIFNATEFLKIYPDPETYFTNPERSVTENYKQHAKVKQKIFPVFVLFSDWFQSAIAIVS